MPAETLKTVPETRLLAAVPSVSVPAPVFAIVRAVLPSASAPNVSGALAPTAKPALPPSVVVVDVIVPVPEVVRVKPPMLRAPVLMAALTNAEPPLSGFSVALPVNVAPPRVSWAVPVLAK